MMLSNFEKIIEVVEWNFGAVRYTDVVPFVVSVGTGLFQFEYFG